MIMQGLSRSGFSVYITSSIKTHPPLSVAQNGKKYDITPFSGAVQGRFLLKREEEWATLGTLLRAETDPLPQFRTVDQSSRRHLPQHHHILQGKIMVYGGIEE